jgi:uncharacterized protein (DUF934 family)
MPLIRKGETATNSWTFAGGKDEISYTEGGTSLTLSQFLNEVKTAVSVNTPVGVRLSPEDDPAELAPYLDKLTLIEVDFPKYTDGRGYSQAQLLRRRYGYEGELRAVGQVLTDQILYMHRSGFDAYDTARADLSSVLKALEEYSDVYQPAADGRVSVFRKRQN